MMISKQNQNKWEDIKQVVQTHEISNAKLKRLQLRQSSTLEGVTGQTSWELEGPELASSSHVTHCSAFC